jgi:hypothetical protein
MLPPIDWDAVPLQPETPEEAAAKNDTVADAVERGRLLLARMWANTR